MLRRWDCSGVESVSLYRPVVKKALISSTARSIGVLSATRIASGIICGAPALLPQSSKDHVLAPADLLQEDLEDGVGRVVVVDPDLDEAGKGGRGGDEVVLDAVLVAEEH